MSNNRIRENNKFEKPSSEDSLDMDDNPNEKNTAVPIQEDNNLQDYLECQDELKPGNASLDDEMINQSSGLDSEISEQCEDQENRDNFNHDPGLKFQITSYYPFRPVIRKSQKMLEKIDLFSCQVESSKQKFQFQSPTNYVLPPKDVQNGKAVKDLEVVAKDDDGGDDDDNPEDVSKSVSAKSQIQIFEMKMKLGVDGNHTSQPVVERKGSSVRSKVFSSTFAKFCQESNERLQHSKSLHKEDFKRGCVSRLTRQFSFESKNASK